MHNVIAKTEDKQWESFCYTIGKFITAIEGSSTQYQLNRING